MGLNDFISYVSDSYRHLLLIDPINPNLNLNNSDGSPCLIILCMHKQSKQLINRDTFHHHNQLHLKQFSYAWFTASKF
jgi:hypothetical protein